MKPIVASKKPIDKSVYQNLRDKRVKQKAKFKLGQLVRTADIKRVFSKGDSTNYSYKLYTTTEVIHNTIPSHRKDYLPRDIMKTYYYQHHYLLKETIMLWKN